MSNSNLLVSQDSLFEDQRFSVMQLTALGLSLNCGDKPKLTVKRNWLFVH